MNNINIKDVVKFILAIIALFCVYKHPIITIGLLLIISAITIPMLIQVSHRDNLKIIDTKVKHSLNCEYCGTEIVAGALNCPNC